MSKYPKLPKPDDRGNYWFGKPTDSSCPAILTFHSLLDGPKGKGGGREGYYLLSLPSGVVFEDGRIKLYASALEAFRDLQARLPGDP